MSECPKCGATSGDDWRYCLGACPMPASPHYTPYIKLVPAAREAFAQLRLAANSYAHDGRTIGDLKLTALEYGARVLLDLKLLDGGEFRQKLADVLADVLRIARERPGSLP